MVREKHKIQIDVEPDILVQDVNGVKVALCLA